MGMDYFLEKGVIVLDKCPSQSDQYIGTAVHITEVALDCPGMSCAKWALIASITMGMSSSGSQRCFLGIGRVVLCRCFMPKLTA